MIEPDIRMIGRLSGGREPAKEEVLIQYAQYLFPEAFEDEEEARYEVHRHVDR